jgi:hypothetical protein
MVTEAHALPITFFALYECAFCFWATALANARLKLFWGDSFLAFKLWNLKEKCPAANEDGLHSQTELE